MRQLDLRVLDDDEDPAYYTYNIIFHNVNYPNLRAIAEQLQVYLEERISPIKIAFSGTSDSYYDTFMLYFTRKQAKKLLRKILPCPKEGMELYFRGIDFK